jgi:hypothetical protein
LADSSAEGSAARAGTDTASKSKIDNGTHNRILLTG